MTRRWGVVLVVALLACVVVPARAGDGLARAALLHRAASEDLGDTSLETRQRAVRQLEEAIELDPGGHAGNHWKLLGYVRELGSYDKEAKECYLRAAAQAPHDREIWLGLGRVYKRQYLRTLDRDALHDALAALDTACACFPPSSEPWCALVPLRYEVGDLAGAAAAAENALRLYPRLPNAVLAAATMAWRTGMIERSDSLFRVAIPLLPADVRGMLEHPERAIGRPARRKVLLAAADSTPPTRGVGALPEIPRAGEDVLPDPDPTTPQNELLLEYQARVAHAWLLFDDPIRPGLDARAETYIRYGPPASVQMNPLGTALTWKPNPNVPAGRGGDRRASTAEFPLDAQLWTYPDLDMQILLHDRSLQGRYTLPALREPLPNSTPSAAALARRKDLAALGDGFAVLPTLPPRAQRLDVALTPVAFEAGAQARLAVYAQVAGDSLQARWVVTDARGHSVASGAQAMRHSLCGGGLAVAEFGATLPPGRYDVVVTARDGRGHRGLARASATLREPLELLSMSDLVPCCGDAAMLVDRDAVRLDPLADHVVRGREPLAVYFEIYHLAADAGGVSRYTFDYHVEQLALDPVTKEWEATGTFSTWASREEAFRGGVRRQFVSVPTASLPAGEYRVVVSVHDTLAGTTEVATLRFTRAAPR